MRFLVVPVVGVAALNLMDQLRPVPAQQAKVMQAVVAMDELVMITMARAAVAARAL
jgi:hypothetical protein